MSWSLELFRTVDGLRLGELPLVDFSWSLGLREGHLDGPPTGVGEADVTSLEFSLDALTDTGWINPEVRGWQNTLLHLFMPIKHGIMLLRDGAPLVGGPIGGVVSITETGVSLDVDSWATILGSRFVVPESLVKGLWTGDRQIRFAGQSLGTIGKSAMVKAMEKPSGALPFTFPVDEAARHERTYQAFNVANLSVADIHEKLANVISGPDITYRPYVASPQKFAWRYMAGSNRDPYLGQDVLHDWEYGSEDVHGLTVDVSAEFIAHRVYGVGDGQDVGTLVTRRDVEVPPEWPLIEKVVSDSGIKKLDLLNEFADGHLNQWPLAQPRMTVRADGSTPLGTFWPGEMARVTVSGHPAFPDDTYDFRILSMSGDAGENVELVFDPVVITQW